MKEALTITEVNNATDQLVPFVNEECGDTLWDTVLAQYD